MRAIRLLPAFFLSASFAVAQTAVVPSVNSPQTGAGGKNVESSAFVSTSPQTMTATSDTSCFGTGFTISANTAVVGNRYRLRCAGYYTVPVSNTRNLTFKLKWGTTVINSNSMTPTPANTNPYPWWVDATCTVATIGASGSMNCWGTISYQTISVTAGTINVATLSSITGATTIDTTASAKLDITGAWDATTGSPSATANEAGIEIVN